MTVCIAASCDDNGEDKVVLCTDRRSGNALGSSETTLKNIDLKNGWRCLTAGNESGINSLARLYEFHFENKDNIKYSKISDSIKIPLQQRKRQLAEEYVYHRFAIPYAEFISSGKEKLPPDLFHDAFQKISAIELDAELIIVGFLGSTSEIHFTENSGKSNLVTHFAVVGEGGYVASSTLLKRKQHNW